MATQDLIDEAIAYARNKNISQARALAIQALTAEPENPAASYAMGVVETADHRHREAREYFEQAVSGDPDKASYRVNLGYAKVLEGEFDSARAEFESVLSAEPENVHALQNLVWITKFAAGDPLIERIRKLAAAGEPGSDDHIRLNYMLGKALDDIGEYDDAFAAFQTANECQPDEYDRKLHEAFEGAVEEVWTREFLERVKPVGHASDKPVFIVGMPRSGSTLVEEKLCADPRIVGLGEIPDIIQMSTVIQSHHPHRAGFPLWCEDCPPGTFGGLGELYVSNYEERWPEAQRFVNKALMNFSYAGMLEAMFPSGLIIETRRDPIDTCLSGYFKDLNRAHYYSKRLETIAHFYRLYDRTMKHWRGVLDNLVTVQYEDFIKDADGGTNALKQSMGLSIDEPDTDKSQPRYVQTFSAWQVKQPIFTSSVRRWKNYEKHIGPLIDALGDLAS